MSKLSPIDTVINEYKREAEFLSNEITILSNQLLNSDEEWIKKSCESIIAKHKIRYIAVAAGLSALLHKNAQDMQTI